MAYTTQAKIESKIPPPHLNDALDDDRDGTADSGVIDTIIEVASTAVDALLAARYEVPFTTPPAMVQEAALIFACEAIYDRRQILDKNPYTARADDWRELLGKIGGGAGSIDAATEQSFTPGAAITEDVDVDESMR